MSEKPLTATQVTLKDSVPLHVRVAEALGTVLDECPNLIDRDGANTCERCGFYDYTWDRPYPEKCVPRYDTNWSATGPLIERFKDGPGGVELWLGNGEWNAGHGDGRTTWRAAGETALLAVCNLILALSEAGKLETQEVTKA